MAYEQDLVKELSHRSSMKNAVKAGADLVSLWPLTDAGRLRNDAKYAETLQVRITRVLARIMTGQDVTIPDAEYVYEGAEDIPGRPQNLVDALLAANDAYEGMMGFATQGDVDRVITAADRLNSGWNQADIQAVRDLIGQIDQELFPQGTPLEASDDQEEVGSRLASSLVVLEKLITALGAVREQAVKIVPILIFINELNERLGIPRVFLTDDQVFQALDIASDKSIHDFADYLAPLVCKEWLKHRDEVLWDPEEAKRQAKEEDERKSRENLKAKFAHIPEDPNKPPVEL